MSNEFLKNIKSFLSLADELLELQSKDKMDEISRRFLSRICDMAEYIRRWHGPRFGVSSPFNEMNSIAKSDHHDM